MRFESNHSVHALYCVLLNYCAHIKKDHSSQTPVSIIAPKPFVNCIHRECALTSNGKAIDQKVTLRFTGLIFSHQLSKLCERVRTIAKTANPAVKRVTVMMDSEPRSENFAHKSVIRKVYMMDGFELFRIIIE